MEKLIYELVNYGLANGLIDESDKTYTVNKLMEFFGISDIASEDSYDVQSGRELHLILEDIMDEAAKTGLLSADATTNEKDLFDTKVMGLITPPPSVVQRKWNAHLGVSCKEATDFYYNFSKATNYIRTDRIKKDERWSAETEFGSIDISINLSKPEKDPRDIAKAGQAKKSGYPACLLCRENEGYAGTMTHPARQNHRIIPIQLCGEDYYLQYSPYVYYNEHCIIFNKEHIPMKIDKAVFRKLLSFVGQFPHYTAGSNADLPIVGGSILSHDHFQGGCYEFPMVRAPYEKNFVIKGYEDITAGIIKWPLSTIRLRGTDMERIADLSDRILGLWRGYTDEAAFIFSETDGVPHNTITPIARMRDGQYEIDLVLRNNITTDEHPMGVYHPHQEYHHIKKENIGLIEVMGLAILPARLKTELAEIESIVAGALESCDTLPSDQSADFYSTLRKTLSENEKTASHADWVMESVMKDGINSSNIHDILRQEVGSTFAKVLECAGVYKCTDEGREAFMRFIDTI